MVSKLKISAFWLEFWTQQANIKSRVSNFSCFEIYHLYEFWVEFITKFYFIGEGENAVGEGEQEGEGDNDDPDLRSVYVKNVEYSADPETIKDHFQEWGEINRVTIIWDRVTGHPLGYCYIEFESQDSVEKAIELMNDSLFKGRQITVMKKRKNVPYKGKAAMRGSRYMRYGMPGMYMPRRPYYGRYRPY